MVEYINILTDDINVSNCKGKVTNTVKSNHTCNIVVQSIH